MFSASLMSYVSSRGEGSHVMDDVEIRTDQRKKWWGITNGRIVGRKAIGTFKVGQTNGHTKRKHQQKKWNKKRMDELTTEKTNIHLQIQLHIETWPWEGKKRKLFRCLFHCFHRNEESAAKKPSFWWVSSHQIPHVHFRKRDIHDGVPSPFPPYSTFLSLVPPPSPRLLLFVSPWH